MPPSRDPSPIPAAAPGARVLAVRGDRVERRPDRLAGEEPLQLRAAGPGQEPVDVAVTMRTPGDEEELAAGFLVTEGLVAPAELAGATFAVGDPATHAQPHDELLVRLATPFDASRVATRTAVATASCGICGKASIEDVAQRCGMLSPGPLVARSTLLALPGAMRAAQAVFERTGGLHAAARFTAEGELLRLREDVGRHNALDKLIGASALAGELPLSGSVVLVSGRVSFEVAQKAAVAGVSVLVAISAPTDLAVETARAVGMTLVGFLRGDGFNVYAGEERLDLAR
ncbi:MAG: formate dehydrogenase accessory sulfurtransferase FdhD [Chloroflexota bacterium]